MIFFLIAMFFIFLLLLILSASAIGSGNYGFAAAYLVFSLIVAAFSVYFLITTRVDPLEQECEALGGIYYEESCYDFLKSPIIHLVEIPQPPS